MRISVTIFRRLSRLELLFDYSSVTKRSISRSTRQSSTSGGEATTKKKKKMMWRQYAADSTTRSTYVHLPLPTPCLHVDSSSAARRQRRNVKRYNLVVAKKAPRGKSFSLVISCKVRVTVHWALSIKANTLTSITIGTERWH